MYTFVVKQIREVYKIDIIISVLKNFETELHLTLVVGQ